MLFVGDEIGLGGLTGVVTNGSNERSSGTDAGAEATASTNGVKSSSPRRSTSIGVGD